MKFEYWFDLPSALIDLLDGHYEEDDSKLSAILLTNYKVNISGLTFFRKSKIHL